MPANDPFDLQRFVDAQRAVYSTVVSELRSGEKRSHWMWFIFPQLEGLGYSAMSKKYSIKSLEEARAYLAHPVLGPRLIECTELVNAIGGKTLDDIFGYPDNLKFRSCMELFARAEPSNATFRYALEKFTA